MTKKTLLYFLLIFSFQSLYANNDVFVYLLKYTKSNGKEVVVYCGITNNPEQRALEHADGHTMGYNTFDTMLVIAGPMSREQALQQETDCIYRYPIPRLYQTYPNDQIRPSDLDESARAAAIAKYESRVDTSRLAQTPDPLVIYTDEVRERLLCENCDSAVTEGVINFSHMHFGSHVFCMECQQRDQSVSETVRRSV